MIVFVVGGDEQHAAKKIHGQTLVARVAVAAAVKKPYGVTVVLGETRPYVIYETEEKAAVGD